MRDRAYGLNPACLEHRYPSYPAIKLSGHSSALGYERTRQKGSHVRLVAGETTGGKPLSIPRHKELKRGLLRGLIRDAGITVEEFRDAL